MPYVSNADVRIYYEVMGNGAPLFLHHGFTQSSERWALHGYLDALKDQFQLILIDARGHGRSDKPHSPEAYRYPVMVEDVVAILDALELETVHYWGYSMGCRVGYEIASNRPERISKFILGAAHPNHRDATMTAEQSSEPEAFLKRFYGRLRMDLDSIPKPVMDEIMKNDFQALHAFQQVARPSVAAGLKSLTHPTLLYWGTEDPVMDPMTKYAADIPHAQSIVLDGLDHGATFRNAEAILPQAIEFLTT